jgi:hypothetical protein
MKARAFKGDLKTVRATLKALGWTPEQIAEELSAPWYRYRDLAEALEDGEIGDVRSYVQIGNVRSGGRIIAGSKFVVPMRLRLNRERARQGRSRPRGRPKKTAN